MCIFTVKNYVKKCPLKFGPLPPRTLEIKARKPVIFDGHFTGTGRDRVKDRRQECDKSEVIFNAEV